MKEVSLKKLKLKQSSTLDVGPSQPVVNGIIKKELPTGSSSNIDRDSYGKGNGDHSYTIEMDDEDASASYVSGLHQIDAEMKVDVRNLTMSDTPPYQNGPHNSTKATKNSELAAPQSRPSRKLVTTKDFSSPNSICFICDKKFVSPNAYKLHHQAVHRRRKCRKCNRLFASRHNLELHQRMQNCTPIARKCGVERHSCKFCDKSYSTKNDLKSHVDTMHLRSSGHVCSQCAKVFIKSSNLKVHMKSVHQGIREHRCNVCPKSYASTSALKYHQITAHASG